MKCGIAGRRFNKEREHKDEPTVVADVQVATPHLKTAFLLEDIASNDELQHGHDTTAKRVRAQHSARK